MSGNPPDWLVPVRAALPPESRLELDVLWGTTDPDGIDRLSELLTRGAASIRDAKVVAQEVADAEDRFLAGGLPHAP